MNRQSDSFEIQSPDHKPKTIKRGERYPLVVRYNAFIEGLTAVCLRHDVYLKVGKLPVIIVPIHGALVNRGLWVEISVLDDGLIQTHGFNMTNQRLLIRRGEVVSFLICL